VVQCIFEANKYVILREIMNELINRIKRTKKKGMIFIQINKYL